MVECKVNNVLDIATYHHDNKTGVKLFTVEDWDK